MLCRGGPAGSTASIIASTTRQHCRDCDQQDRASEDRVRVRSTTDVHLLPALYHVDLLDLLLSGHRNNDRRIPLPNIETREGEPARKKVTTVCGASRALGRILYTTDLRPFCTPPGALSKQRIGPFLVKMGNSRGLEASPGSQSVSLDGRAAGVRNAAAVDSSHPDRHGRSARWHPSPVSRYPRGFEDRSRYRVRSPHRSVPTDCRRSRTV